MSEALSAKEISGGVVHDLPADLKKALISDVIALESGRTLRLWRAMNGSAGSSRPKRLKQELIGSNWAVPASKKENGDPVVGLAVRIVEIIATHIPCTRFHIGFTPEPNRNVRYGSLADIRERISDVCFTPSTRHAHRWHQCLAKCQNRSSGSKRGRTRVSRCA